MWLVYIHLFGTSTRSIGGACIYCLFIVFISIQVSMRETVQTKYSIDAKITSAMDKMQTNVGLLFVYYLCNYLQFACCGASNYSDYKGSQWLMKINSEESLNERNGKKARYMLNTLNCTHTHSSRHASNNTHNMLSHTISQLWTQRSPIKHILRWVYHCTVG
jgi:hypothetical protein